MRTVSCNTLNVLLYTFIDKDMLLAPTIKRNLTVMFVHVLHFRLFWQIWI